MIDVNIYWLYYSSTNRGLNSIWAIGILAYWNFGIWNLGISTLGIWNLGISTFGIQYFGNQCKLAYHKYEFVYGTYDFSQIIWDILYDYMFLFTISAFECLLIV